MLSLLVLTGSILLGQSEPAAGDSLRLEVRRLVRQLDAPQLADREVAEEKLLQLGPAVLDLLPASGDSVSAEVAQRAGRLRQKLQRRVAEAATRGSYVTLPTEAHKFSKILAAIQEQTGNKILDDRQRMVGPATDPEIRIGFEKAPFWQALDQVLDRASLTIYPFGEGKGIHVVPCPEGRRPRAGQASYAGPFRVEPVRVTADCDLRNPANRSLAVTVEIAWEPRLSPISLQQRLSEISAVDEQGNSLAIDGRDADLEVPIEPDAMAKELRLPLALPPRTVREIARLEGSFTALVPGKIETFRFKDLAQARDKEAEQRQAGVTVMLEQVRQNNKSWEVRIRVRFDQASGALQSHRNWIFDNEAYLEGPDGKRVSYGTFETTRQTKDEVGLAYLFRPDRPIHEYAFVYKTAGAILSTPFRYQLRNIKLP